MHRGEEKGAEESVSPSEGPRLITSYPGRPTAPQYWLFSPLLWVQQSKVCVYKFGADLSEAVVASKDNEPPEAADVPVSRSPNGNLFLQGGPNKVRWGLKLCH